MKQEIKDKIEEIRLDILEEYKEIIQDESADHSPIFTILVNINDTDEVMTIPLPMYLSTKEEQQEFRNIVEAIVKEINVDNSELDSKVVAIICYQMAKGSFFKKEDFDSEEQMMEVVKNIRNPGDDPLVKNIILGSVETAEYGTHIQLIEICEVDDGLKFKELDGKSSSSSNFKNLFFQGFL